MTGHQIQRAARDLAGLPPSPLERGDEFEAFVGLVRGLADAIRALPEEELLKQFRDDGGDPRLGAEEARQAMLEDLRRRFVG